MENGNKVKGQKTPGQSSVTGAQKQVTKSQNGGVRRTFSQPVFNGESLRHDPPSRPQLSRAQLPVSGQLKQSSVTISKEEAEAVESLKPELESMVNKYNEFIKKQDEFAENYKKVTSNNRLLNKKSVESIFGIPFNIAWFEKEIEKNFQRRAVNVDNINTLQDCYQGWRDMWILLSEFLTEEDKKAYELAFLNCSFGENMSIEGKKSTIEKARRLVRRIFRYMQHVQDRLFERTAGGTKYEAPRGTESEEKPDLNEYIKLEKSRLEEDSIYDRTLPDINKTLETDNSQNINNCFKAAIGKFIKSDGDLVESFKATGINSCFDGIADKKFKKALKNALNDTVLKKVGNHVEPVKETSNTISGAILQTVNKSGKKLEDKEIELRAAMGVLFISMAYLDSSKDVAAACDGLKNGGLKGEKNEFVRNGSAVRKAIKDAARGGFSGEKIIKLLQTPKVKGAFSFFIGNNVTKSVDGIKDIEKIMNKYKPLNKKSSLRRRKASGLVKGVKKLASKGAKGVKKFFGFGKSKTKSQ